MDPRIRRRRVDVRREEGRHRLRVLVALSSVVVAGCAGWGATRSPLFDLDRVKVEGAAHVTEEEVRAASGLRPGQPLTDVEPGAVAEAVEVALPWVQGASVHRNWPGAVTIRLVERAPVAAMAAEPAGFALVDAGGLVLEHVDAVPPGVVQLAGLPPAGEPGTRLSDAGVATLAVAVALPPALVARTAGVGPAEGGTGEVELRLTPEGMVKLGPPDDLLRKFDAVAAVMAQVDLRNLAVLDVRRPESPVLTRREAPTKVSTPRTG